MKTSSVLALLVTVIAPVFANAQGPTSPSSGATNSATSPLNSGSIIGNSSGAGPSMTNGTLGNTGGPVGTSTTTPAAANAPGTLAPGTVTTDLGNGNVIYSQPTNPAMGNINPATPGLQSTPFPSTYSGLPSPFAPNSSSGTTSGTTSGMTTAPSPTP